MADTDVATEEAPLGNEGDNGSVAAEAPRQPQQQPNGGSPANAAFAAQRKEISTLKSQLESFQKETEPLKYLATALEEMRGGGQPKADPNENPHDPVTNLSEYNRWNRERENTVTQSAQQTAEKTASQTASSTYQRERRVELTGEAEDSFLNNHPNFSDGNGNWRDDLKSTVVAEAVQMMTNGQGSGKYGAVTTQDIEGLLWKNEKTRSEMQTASVRNSEGRVINGMQQAEQARRPRGTVSLDQITSVAEARQALNNLGVDTVEAARLLDQLPDEIALKL